MAKGPRTKQQVDDPMQEQAADLYARIAALQDQVNMETRVRDLAIARLRRQVRWLARSLGDLGTEEEGDPSARIAPGGPGAGHVAKTLPQTAAQAANGAPAAGELPAGAPAIGQGDEPADAHTALKLLIEAGFENPDKVLGSYLPARIVEVCRAAIAAGERCHNPPAWIHQALRRGWHV